MAASSIVSGSSGSNNPRGYSIEPSEIRQPHPEPKEKTYYPNDEETKISFSCSHGSLFLKLSSVLLIFSFILQAISIGAPFWAAGWRRDKMAWHEGVWMTCVNSELDNKWICGSYDVNAKKPGVPSWYTACQAMGLGSLVVFLPALLINIFYTVHPKEKMFRGLMWFNFCLTAVTGLFPLLILIIFAAGHPRKDRFPISYIDEEYDDSPFEFHVSFAFAIIATFLSFGALVLEVVDFKRSDYGH